MKKQFGSLKKAILTFGLAFGVLAAPAQTLQEVVYLKNGSIVRGTVIEQVPNESLKVQMADGSIFVYPMSEVAKIAKEAPVQPAAAEKAESDSYGWNTGTRYRGFVGEGYVFGVGGWKEDRLTTYTSHGCQFNPYLYAGLGAAVTYWCDSEVAGVPVFAHVRSELHQTLRKNVSPYAEIKAGYSFGDTDGFYFSPSLGCHFYFGHSKVGISAGLSYVMQRVTVEHYGWGYYYTDRQNAHGLELSVALDF